MNKPQVCVNLCSTIHTNEQFRSPFLLRIALVSFFKTLRIDILLSFKCVQLALSPNNTSKMMKKGTTANRRVESNNVETQRDPLRNKSSPRGGAGGHRGARNAAPRQNAISSFERCQIFVDKITQYREQSCIVFSEFFRSTLSNHK